MPDQNTEDADKLRKLGQRLRSGWKREHPVSEKSLETVRGAVREQWEKEQEANRGKAADERTPTKNKEREPEEPDQDH